MTQQLIYRQERRKPFDVDLASGCRFILCTGFRDGLSIVRLLLKRMGAAGVVRDIMKLATPSRHYACLLDEGSIVSECYIVLSHCRHYEVEKSAAVLGPVWTDDKHRGRGLGTCLLKMTMNRLIANGHFIFYIDTSDQNIAMQCVIAHCGFGEPIEKVAKTKPIR